MAAKKSTAKKTTAKKRSSSGTGKASGTRTRSRSRSTGGIPKAASTVSVLVANKDILTNLAGDLSVQGLKNAATSAIQPDQIKKDIAAGIGGYLGGYVAAKVAPKVIKTPMNKIAKKINGVF